MLLRYFSVFAIAFASTCTTLNRIQCGGNQTLDWGESECVGASCCWNPNVVDILYRCTKNGPRCPNSSQRSKERHKLRRHSQ
ncbi:unnamed protein product [Oikopleura dioica]|uniref:P-type domain-containing protein n=1 Tax=Oikopleura dioica TaxID=34765 RepID=E4Y475_OIKDI|nr:unnamed protein product [Oikopleura dioica]